MVIPSEIGDAVQDADRDRVMAWLDAGGSINDVEDPGYYLVYCCACGTMEGNIIRDQHVALVRHLIALGADVNITTELMHTAKHEIVQRHGEPQAVLEMLSLLLGARANVNARNAARRTPLCSAISHDASALRTKIITSPEPYCQA